MWSHQIYANRIQRLRKGFSSQQQGGGGGSVGVVPSRFNHLNALNSHAIYKPHELTIQTERSLRGDGKEILLRRSAWCSRGVIIKIASVPARLSSEWYEMKAPRDIGNSVIHRMFRQQQGRNMSRHDGKDKASFVLPLHISIKHTCVIAVVRMHFMCSELCTGHTAGLAMSSMKQCF